jgi:hypothetical protein
VTAHTPGPWIFDVDNIGADFSEGYGIYTEASGKALAHIPTGGDPGNGVGAANARLIAVAPDFYDAAVLLLSQYDAEPDFTMGGRLTNEPFLLFRAAIAKVKA